MRLNLRNDEILPKGKGMPVNLNRLKNRYIAFYIQIALASILILASCVTPPVENFSRVSVGMDKTDVLDKIGSPKFTEIRDGNLVWTYRFYEKDKVTEKEVEFNEKGFVHRLGDPAPEKASKALTKGSRHVEWPTPTPKPVFRELDSVTEGAEPTPPPNN